MFYIDNNDVLDDFFLFVKEGDNVYDIDPEYIKDNPMHLRYTFETKIEMLYKKGKNDPVLDDETFTDRYKDVIGIGFQDKPFQHWRIFVLTGVVYAYTMSDQKIKVGAIKVAYQWKQKRTSDLFMGLAMANWTTASDIVIDGKKQQAENLLGIAAIAIKEAKHNDKKRNDLMIDLAKKIKI